MSGPLKAGDLIGGRYEIQRYVAEGGMQFVYAANDTVINRLVALKTPKNRSAMKRFRRSAVVAAKVNHPNVAKTLDYVRDGEERYLIEEMIVGQDLDKAILKRARFLDPYLAAKVFHYLAKGVGAAHHAGVVHRDLKPTNIMVVGGYSLAEIKLTDFGIAKLAAEEIEAAAEGGTLTMSQTAVGALPYMAPEAIETPKEVGSPADIWSLGTMMYQLITGELPFGSQLRAVTKILAAVQPTPPKFVTANAQFAPLAKQVAELALSCMQRDPTTRPTADELATACSAFCYSSGPRREGIVDSIMHNAWGFISSPDGRVFFNHDCTYGPVPVQVGDHVAFVAHQGGGAPRAYPVIKLDPPT